MKLPFSINRCIYRWHDKGYEHGIPVGSINISESLITITPSKVSIGKQLKFNQNTDYPSLYVLKVYNYHFLDDLK